MDILNAKIIKPPTLAKVRTTLMEAEKSAGAGVGVTTWIAIALKIQEAQISLKSYIRRLPKSRSDEQELEIARRREALYGQIDHLYETASLLFPGADIETLKLDEVPCESVEVDGEEEPEEAGDNPFSLSQNEMEDVKLPLPSSLSTSSTATSIASASEKELKLRIAQADDALENIRTEVGHKSYLYRSNIRLAEGKKQKTRGYTAVKLVNNSLRDHIKVYNQARWAMRRLGADTTTLLHYRAIKPDDIRAVTAIYQPNARGQRNKSLSWIWNLNVSGDSQKSEYLEELYRVNWLRAKSRHDRWREEFTLLTSEMDWVLNFFTFKQREWTDLSQKRSESPGHMAFARREAEKWGLLYTQARKAFEKTRNARQIA
ncbi:hypothetical protein CC1G_10669 [Coprinopsis cinerea okayama7|uniref:Uncharacterized protein n=1 Tax=Coprinopsis cinerea (strain Okayama-7 / 130 / ATCC MYA-4618 / FGSC 9003) TaxID=240176 RepID=A8NDP3_COPC7|nr:hypothetical protein CC1G_10669 [Coprinopsis cinerea okayama7\|eukprot:XP_001832820.2 hypothetical protein CC1G_10669 [Coprinopsis cinerea okayama7\